MPPYVGEIRMGPWPFVPAGWAPCDGRLLQIAENDVLFVLIGTRYGGDGESTFALPNLTGRLPVHARGDSSSLPAGAMGGVEEVALTTQQMPAHRHTLLGSVDVATTNAPDGNVPASLTPAGTQRAYRSVPLDLSGVAPTSVTVAGGSQPHDNMHPYLVIRFVISLYGEFPSPS